MDRSLFMHKGSNGRVRSFAESDAETLTDDTGEGSDGKGRARRVTVA